MIFTIITLAMIIPLVISNLNELNSVYIQGGKKFNKASRLIQQLVLSEAMYNEKIIYITNIITNIIILSALEPITELSTHANLLETILTVVIEVVICLIISNLISARVDSHYDRKWITAHKELIKKSWGEP